MTATTTGTAALGPTAQQRAWNATSRGFTADGPVHRRFEAQARLRPDAVAVRWAGGTLTFAELDRRANRLAWALRDRGVGPQTPVGIRVPRGPQLAVAVYGVLKAGGYYLPVEPALPAGRAHTLLAEAGARVLVVAAGGDTWAVPAGVAAVAADHPVPDRRELCAPEPGTDADSTAYVVFTSGTTGRPNGVEVAHRSLHNLFAWCQRTHGFGPHDLGLSVASFGFDLSVFDLLGLPGYGAGVYIADDAQRRDPELLLDVLLREPVTFWNSAPTTLAHLAPLLDGHRDDAGTGDLRLVYLAGDFPPLTLPDDVRSVFTRATIVNLGGTTETTVWANWFEVGAVDPAWRSVPYGRPIDNAQYWVVDEDLRPCPVGVPGDLLIGGDVLSIGYHGQPELTAQRFIPDTLGPDPGGRLYRTGDRASFGADGVLTILGRVDGQVKIRGARVELGEVEHCLRGHAEVRDVVALARPDRDGDRVLVAYVRPAPGCRPTVRELRRHVAAALPDYMVPAAIVFVDGFPATANGKLDRAALPWPARTGSTHALGVPG
ncbi:amino acid adenylation domain-containing protein [Micromonospora sp. C51]|uniref:amino acid adenylation domain-containing protein n=1 Tax=Micromonospora sp. C51 TaxID=2824879 RepID=UPI001B38CDB7|nr:amino acid adenylation domain-containing protein [Micromonospora sp. C51]MBQ1047560.1 amino acid adenylation domain-containing protein [Micromonospora sp. C51]